MRWRELFEHAPAGKVVCVDVYGDAMTRRVYMLADEGTVARGSVPAGRPGRPCRSAFRGGPCSNRRTRSNYAAVDIDPAVLAGGAGFSGQLVKRLFVLHEVLCEVFQHERAIVKRMAPQVRSAGLARIGMHGREVDAVTRYRSDRPAVDRAGQRLAVARAQLPIRYSQNSAVSLLVPVLVAPRHGP